MLKRCRHWTSRSPACCAAVRWGLLDPVRIDEALEDFAALRIERHQMAHLLAETLDLRKNFAAHNAVYIVVLALGRNAPLSPPDATMAEAPSSWWRYASWWPVAHGVGGGARQRGLERNNQGERMSFGASRT